MESAKLIEPGVSYFLEETLKKCHDEKWKYNNLVIENIKAMNAIYTGLNNQRYDLFGYKHIDEYYFVLIENINSYIVPSVLNKVLWFNIEYRKALQMTYNHILNWYKNIYKLPVVAIGGINNKNYKNLLLNQADFLAISGYVWKNKNLKPHQAIKKFIK